MSKRFAARFFDGKIIKPAQAAVEIKENGLIIAYSHQQNPVEVFWTAAHLQILELPHHGRPAIVGCTQTLGARLVLPDEAAFKAILPLVPKQQIRHAGFHQPWRVVFWLPILFVVIFVSILWGIQLSAPLLARAMPEQWDDNLGQWTIEGIAGERLECVAPEGLKALNKITARLTQTAESPQPFDIRIVQWGEVNAFAAPGHHIVIMSGLLHLTEKPEEVAGVLAHEMGHAIEHHPTQSVIRQVGFKVFINAALGSTYGLTSDLLILKYSRKDESQADEIGRRLLEKGQIDPQGLIDFFKKLAKLEGERALRAYWLDYLSSHPNTEERIKSLQIQPAKSIFQPLLSQKEWQALKNICRQTQPLKFDSTKEEDNQESH